jgi:hypothetical protein
MLLDFCLVVVVMLLEVGLDRATNAMYGMLCNGWDTGIVL